MKESALCCLIKFAAAEGQNPLEDLDWSEHYSFPREMIQVSSFPCMYYQCVILCDISAMFFVRVSVLLKI